MIGRIKFDSKKCCGCKTCQLVCSYKNEKIYNPDYSRIKIITNYKDLNFNANICLQCSNAVCIEACPNKAIYKDNCGVVKIDYELCTGCKLCIDSCYFGGIGYIENKVIKCQLCDGEPECAKACPTGALAYELIR